MPTDIEVNEDKQMEMIERKARINLFKACARLADALTDKVKKDNNL